MDNKLILLSEAEAVKRLQKVTRQMKDLNLPTALIRDFSNIYYLTGRVFDGYIMVDAASGKASYFVKRPIHLSGHDTYSISKPENIAETLSTPPEVLGLELDTIPYSLAMRLAKAFGGCALANASAAMRNARAVKTPQEIATLKADGVKHDLVYRRIPQLYTDGMTDIELQVEIERVSRLEGCLGQFRVSGDTMEIYMGNILAGDNADSPSPYDFAMGGEGADPSLPVGANGTVIRRGMSVMVDMNGNFNGYMTDMTRTFSLGDIAPKALKAHDCSIRICHELASLARPGMPAKALYEKAMAIVEEEGLSAYFMGHRQHAGFIGHGVGIQINELPVISPRSKDTLMAGNAIALEPKFVIPGTGAVGIENTYVLTDNGLEVITHSPEQIIHFGE